MARAVSRLYDTYGDAQRAVNALEAAGFTTSEIGMVSRYRDDETLADTTSGAATGAAAGAVVGGRRWAPGCARRDRHSRDWSAGRRWHPRHHGRWCGWGWRSRRCLLAL